MFSSEYKYISVKQDIFIEKVYSEWLYLLYLLYIKHEDRTIPFQTERLRTQDKINAY